MDATNIELGSFPNSFRALVIGANGAIGRGFIEHLTATPHCANVVGISRHTQPALDFASETSVNQFIEQLNHWEPFHLIILATGMLHTSQWGPEKKASDLSFEKMQTLFQVNTFGPAAILGPLARKLDRQRGVLAVLSAKVGSIEDNRLGGWYSYRASKAALNMFVKTAAIEVKRTAPLATLVALHPGTVASPLSKPFGGETTGSSPSAACAAMLSTLNSLSAADSGCFVSYSGERLAW